MASVVANRRAVPKQYVVCLTPEQRGRLEAITRNGSWLNVAEIELAILSRQCLDRRIGSADELARELTAWEQQRNSEASVVHWRFTTADARIRLRHLYPQF
jgi:hypothetical protein